MYVHILKIGVVRVTRLKFKYAGRIASLEWVKL